MSDKEKIIQLLENVPDYKMGYVLVYLQGITADEEAPLPDEMEAIKRADKSIAENGTVPHEAINWD